MPQIASPYDTSGSSFTNNLGALNANLEFILGGQATVGFFVTGTTGTLTLTFQYTIDNINWQSLSVSPVGGVGLVTTTTGNGAWIAATAGFYAVRAILTAYTSGSMNVSAVAVPAPSPLMYVTDGISGPAGVAPANTAATKAQPALVVTPSPNGVFLTQPGPIPGAYYNIAIGKVTNGGAVSNTKIAINQTTYTEQSTGAQRSLSSSSANDTAAGTGARTVVITYYPAGVTSRNTETVTLNGTTPVNTVNTDICFVESIVIQTVGSGGTNAGVISLHTTTAGGGSVFGSIAVAVSGTANEGAIDGRTYWAHHYVVSGKTCIITTFDGATQGNQNGEMFLSSKDLSIANAIDVQVSDSISIGLNAAISLRLVPDTIQIVGPARITAYVVPAGNSTAYYGSFDFYED